MPDLAPARRKRRRPRLAPALLRRIAAAGYCGVSPSAWDRASAAGLIPTPRRIGGCVLWSRVELARWIAAGCPDRQTWDAIRAAERGAKR